MIKKLLIFSFLIASTVSCSFFSGKGPSEKYVSFLPEYKEEVKFLVLSGEVQIRSPKLRETTKYQLTLAGADSMRLEIFGPLSMKIAVLFANRENFIFLNIFEGKAFKGKATAENLNQAFNMPLSSAEFMRLFRAETPEPPNSFEKFAEDREIGKQFFNLEEEDGKRNVVYSAKYHSISEYEKRDIEGDVVYKTYMRKLFFSGKNSFPGEIDFDFPDMNASVLFTIDDFESLQSYDAPLSLEIPDKVKVQILD